MKRLATYKFSDLNDVGVDKMPVGSQGVVNQFGNLTRFVKGVEDAALLPTTTIGEYLANNIGDYYKDVLYISNNYVYSETPALPLAKSYSATSSSGQTDILLDYAEEMPLKVYIDNIIQPADNYTANNGTTIIMNSALIAGQDIVVMYFLPSTGTEEFTLKNMIENKSQSVTTNFSGVTVNSTGTKMMIGSTTGNDNVYVFDMAIPWDIGTATLSSSTIFNHNHVIINENGTQIIYSKPGNANLYMNTLATAWDLSTLESEQTVGITGSLNSCEGGVTPIRMVNPTKLHLGIQTAASTNVSKMLHSTVDLTIANDFSSIDSSTLQTSSLVWQEPGSACQKYESTLKSHFNEDGTVFYGVLTTNSEKNISEYALTTPWNLNSAVFVSTFIMNTANVTGISFKPGGQELIGVKSTGELIELVRQ